MAGFGECGQNEVGWEAALELQKFCNRLVTGLYCHMHGKEGLETPLAADLPAGAGGFYPVP